jgi:hypothetical protein
MQIIPIFGGQDGTDMKMNVLKNNRWNLEIRMESGSRKNIDLGPVRPGQWMNVVMRYKRSTGGDGAVQLWIDGKLAADYKLEARNIYR